MGRFGWGSRMKTDVTTKFVVVLIALVFVHIAIASTFVDFCSADRVQAQPLAFENASGQPLEGALLGTGTTGVVLSNDSGNGACSWFPFAQTLAKGSFRVLLYEYASADPSADRLSDLEAAIRAFHQQGVKHLVLVGASQGANLTLIASSQTLPGVEAAVTLSAEARVLASQGEELAPYAAKIALPIFMLTAKSDAYGSDEATPQLYKLAPTKDKKLLVVPGYAHGTELLKEPGMSKKVLEFIRRVL